MLVRVMLLLIFTTPIPAVTWTNQAQTPPTPAVTWPNHAQTPPGPAEGSGDTSMMENKPRVRHYPPVMKKPLVWAMAHLDLHRPAFTPAVRKAQTHLAHQTHQAQTQTPPGPAEGSGDTQMREKPRIHDPDVLMMGMAHFDLHEPELPLIRRTVDQPICNYRQVLTHLGMKKDNELHTATRPVLDHTRPTVVELDVALNAILDVVEKDLKFISYLWIEMKWKDEFISWDPSEFCGIQHFSAPSDYLWKPDITIDERLEKDVSALNPYVHIRHDGTVYVQNDEVVVSSCRINVYKFPFDTQSCNLTFASGIYSTKELELNAAFNTSFTRFLTTRVMWGEHEWEFDNIAYVKLNETAYKLQHRIVYTITMKRKAVLYIVNFLLPVLFFLCLDMASFLIPDRSEEKLSFKITLMLTVTVLQLILNDILPTTSNRMPIIAMYCMGSFALMLLSLLETVLVTFLLDKDSQKTETDKDPNEEDVTKEKRCQWCPPCFYNVPDDDDGDKDTTRQPQSAAEKDSDLKGESHGFQVILDELRDLEKNLHSFLKSKEDGGRPAGYWTRMALRINQAFFILYVTTVVVFLAVLFNEWSPEY